MSAPVLLGLLLSSSSFGPHKPQPNRTSHSAASFVCHKEAFYPTVPGGSGVRQLMLPAAMCAETGDADEMLEHLCCANTHVVCSHEVKSPQLISYDGTSFPMPDDPATVLSAAYGRLCTMMMADKCGDCKQDTCSLFAAKPDSKSCYGKTYTDKPDGSGFKSEAVRSAATTATSCRPVQPLPTLNTTEYLRASWYIQQQQITGYQAKEDLYCVTQTFDGPGDRKVPLYSGTVIAVYNYAVAGSTSGQPVNTGNGTVLCARQTNEKDPARLINAPCFIPNFLAGDYWVIAAGPSADRYDWAIISAGSPTVQYPDGCTTKLTGTNGAGLWLFSRKPIADPADIETMRRMLVDAGYTLSQLLPVPQDGCSYDGAFIKPDVY